MKRKVKKFSRGGDILTALGAGLAGYGAYKYFTKDDQGKDTNTGLEKGIEAGKKKNLSILDEVAREEARKNEAKNEAKPEDKTEVKELSKRGKFPYEAGDGTSGAGLDDKSSAVSSAVSSAASKNAAPRKAAPRKAAPRKEPAKDRTAEFANLYQGLTTKPPEPVAADTRLKPADVSGVGSNVLSNVAGRRREAAKREQAAKDRLAKFEEKRREAKEREARRTQAQNKAKSGTSLKAPGSRFRAPGSKMDLNDPYSMTLGSDLDPKRIVRESKSRMSGDVEYKKGGAVKKYASGGSVSSASKRADGIAMRGKTRGKVC